MVAQSKLQQRVAPMATTIKVITSLYLCVTVLLSIATVSKNILLLPSMLLWLILLLCYLYSPRYYRLDGNVLTIGCVFGEKKYAHIVQCRTFEHTNHFGVRLWGNGGLFSATGLFWSSRYGLFRAYVTCSGEERLVLLETRSQRIVISPENPLAFMRDCRELLRLFREREKGG